MKVKRKECRVQKMLREKIGKTRANGRGNEETKRKASTVEK